MVLFVWLLAGPAEPSGITGFVVPSPVRYTDTVSPTCAGFCAVTSE